MSVWGLEDGDLLGFWGDDIILKVDEGLGSWPRVSGSWLWGGLGDISGGLVWSSGGWVGVVVWDGIWLLSGAWSTGWSVHWSVGSRANFSVAVNSIWSVVTVAFWKRAGAGNLDWVPLNEGGLLLLVVVVWLSLHDDILTEVLITVHAGGEELVVWHASNTWGSSVDASADLEETTGGWHLLVPGWLVEEWWGISGDSTKEKGNNSGLHCFNLFVYRK